MAFIRSLNGIDPVFGDNCFIAETAVVIGDVIMGKDCSVWYNAVIRGDVHSIRIGDRVNIQDNATIHATYKKAPCNIGNRVSIAHNAVIHGCTIGNNVLVGIGAIILDDVVVEDNSIIAAGAVVTKGTIVESGTIYAGSPAKKLKEVSPELLKGEIDRIADSYLMYSDWYKQESKK